MYLANTSEEKMPLMELQNVFHVVWNEVGKNFNVDTL